MNDRYRRTDRHKTNNTIDLYTSFVDKYVKTYTLTMRGNIKSSYSPRSRGRTLGKERLTYIKTNKQLTFIQASLEKM